MITGGAYPNLVILDVRTKDEFDTGHIQNALLIPYTEVEQRISELEAYKDHEIIVYCLKGGRSAIASGLLDGYGFTKVYNMLGGIEAWTGEGYPTTLSYLTYIYFNLVPNPVKTGGKTTLRGILVDQFSNPIDNEIIRFYIRKGTGSWHYVGNYTTNEYGIIVDTLDARRAGIYRLGLCFKGTVDYEPSYKIYVLIVRRVTDLI